MSEPVKKDGVPLKSLRFVEVRWLDAAAEASWTSIHDTDIVAAPCISRGWIMRQDETQILLCGTVGMGADGLVEEANAIISIPRPMIQSVEDFPIRPKRRTVAKKKQKVEQPIDPAVLTEQVKEALNG